MKNAAQSPPSQPRPSTLPMPCRPLAASASVLLSLAVCLVPRAQAADRTWNDTATDFNDAGSWGGTAPGTGDAALFPTDATIDFQPNVTADKTIQQVRFNAADTSGYTLSATSPFKLSLTATGTTVGAIPLAGAGGVAIAANNTSGTNTISAPIVLARTGGAALQTIAQAAGGTLVLSGPISSGGSNSGVQFVGNGTIKLDGANTYAGGTQIGITAGAGTTTVQIGNDSAFSSGTVTLGAGSGGTIGFANLQAVGAARSVANNILLAQNASISGALALTLANLSYSQPSARTLTISNSALTTLTQITSTATAGLVLGGSGNIAIGSLVQTSNSTDLTLSTSGVTTISGTNGLLGNMAVSNGTLRVSDSTHLSAGTLRLDTGTTLDLRNDVGQNFGKALTAGNAANTLASAVLNIYTGKAFAGGSGSDQTHSLGNITFGYSGSSTTTEQLNVSGDSGYGLTAGTLTTGNSTSGAPSQTTITNNAPGLLTVGAVVVRSTIAHGIVFDGTGDIEVTGAITKASNVAGLTKNGANTLTLDGTNTYPGNATNTTKVNAGILKLASASALPGGIGTTGGLSNLQLNGGIVGLAVGDFSRGLGTGVTQVQFTGGGGFAAYVADRAVNLGGAGGTVTWGTGSFVPNGSALILGAGSADKTVDFQNAINLNNAARTIRANNGSAGIDGKISGVISSTVAASGSLVKDGAGTLQLTAANTYAGGTTISAGTLNVTTDAGLGAAAGAVAIDNGATLQAGGAVTTTARTVTLGTGGGVIDTNGNAVNLDAGSTVTGTTLTKIGAGTLTLAGAQTYATLTTSAGTTNIDSALGTGTSTLNANATTNISVSQTLAALNIGAGAVVAFGGPAPSADFGGGAQLAAVPEPGTAFSLFSGLALLLGLRRRRA